MNRIRRTALWLSLVVAAPRLLAGQERGAAALGQLVEGLGTTARVLVIAAHPDDEDTRLIAWLAKGRHAETAYLSLTRGDGGQNLVGNELGEALGAIRTEELLAARRIDGGRQFFARAYDFGFSRSAEETAQHWPHDSLLGDVVRVIRAYRPHVVIAIWSGTPADGHGHHQYSGILAREGYDASADTARFPAASFGAPWAVPKFYRSLSYRGNQGATLRYDAGRYDPLLGRSYAEIAAESRTQHKSQGQGGLERKGVSIVSLRREASRVNEGTPAERERDLFDGVDTSAAGAVARAACGEPGRAADSLAATAAAAVADAQRAFDARRPEALLAPLGRLQRTLAAGGAAGAPGPACGERAREDGRAGLALVAGRANAAAALAAGVAVEAEVPREVLAVGDSEPVTVTVYNRGRQPLRVSLRGAGAAAPLTVLPDSSAAAVRWQHARREEESAWRQRVGPWWLARGRDGDVFREPADVRGEERASGPLTVGVVAEAGGAAAAVDAPIVRRLADPVKGDVRRPLAVAPAVSVRLDHALEYARAGVPLSRALHVRLRSADSARRDVTVRLELPAGLAADAPSQTVTLPGYDAQADVTFTLRGTLPPGQHLVRAVAESRGERFAAGYELVDYDHIRPLRLYRPSELALQAVDVALPARASIAYVQGVGDNVAPMLAQLGLPVTMLDPAAIPSTDLSRFTAVVIGQRAYDASEALFANNPRLLAWVRAGGTMVVQGGQYEMMRPGVMPYPVAIARPTARVTHPEAPVAVAEPGAGVLSAPNRIGPADFAGWVQERARYLPQSFDPAYRAPLSINDPGDPPNRGTLLVAPYGKGTYVYTTLSFFRQLPAGNPGAARLFVNLLAARPPAPAAPRSVQ